MRLTALSCLVLSVCSYGQVLRPSPFPLGTSGGGGGGTGTVTSVTSPDGCLTVVNSTTAVQLSANTAVCATQVTLQAGAAVYASSTNASGTTYTAALTPALTAYTTGMVVYWTRTQLCTGGVATTINIDALGAIAVKKADGTTDPAAGDCAAGQRLQLIYDGTVFRILAGGASASTSAAFEDWLHIGQCYNPGAGGIPGWSVSTGVTIACAGGSNKGFATASFSNAGTPTMYRVTRVPTDWSGITPDLILNLMESANGGSGTTIWEAATKCFAPPANIGDLPTPFNTLATVTATVDSGANGGTNKTMRTATIADLPMTGCAAGDVLEIELKRNGGTYANPMGLFGVAVLRY